MTIRSTLLNIALIIGGMLLITIYSPTLYNMFCDITGYGGTTNQADEAPKHILERKITVQFDANTAKDLPWKFNPMQRQVTLNIGENGLAYYKAKNVSDKPVTGISTFNVTPPTAGSYFSKIECFCFENQTLQPGEEIEMPVSFFIDPEIADVDYLEKLDTITLSYTFFVSDDTAPVK